jgi:NitT/TauT family transport system ATP-binding protein
MIMTAQPGRLKLIVPVPLARPRDLMELQKAPELGALVHRIWSSLREEVLRARRQEDKEAKS